MRHLLSEGDFELVLATAVHDKNVPGRKTNANDGAWLAICCPMARSAAVLSRTMAGEGMRDPPVEVAQWTTMASATDTVKHHRHGGVLPSRADPWL